MDELIRDFIAETSEGLQTLDTELVELEQNPQNYELLSSIFRIMHTIKGTCGFLGLNKLASVAHAGENIMDKLRNKQLSVDSNNISLVLESIDVIKTFLSFISEHGKEPDNDYSSLIIKLNNAANQVPSSLVAEKDGKKEEKEKINILNENKIDSAQKPVDKNDLVEVSNQTTQENSSSEANQNKSEQLTNQTIRVHVDVLENLMQIVSELVLNRNQLIQLDRTIRDSRYSAPLQRLNTITSSLQETVMVTRMQPISNAWLKLPRLVRDLSKELNKKIKLVMIGEETELDRQLIESIKDPIMHMIRNSADHGIEPLEERIAAGKPPEGTITLKAYHQGGHIIIEITDDGRGMNIKKIKAKVLKNKLATEKELAAMSDTQATQFIFRAGFSTAEAVTAVSGRGVGMDVVKTNIEAIRGTVDLKSIEGKGSFFSIKIPLTLAIMPVLVVESGAQKFGIPQINVLEMVRVGEASGYVIEEINDHKVLRLRDTLLPLVSLSEILKLDSNKDKINGFIVVCEINGVSFGIIVDRIYDSEEIVLKPVSKVIKSIPVYSGNTLLGNGEIIMIMDLAGVVKFLNTSNQIDNAQVSDSEQLLKADKKLSSFLVLKSRNSLKAIPLELVSRLEEIDVNKIEYAGEKPVIQYRNSLMYLAKLNDNDLPNKGMVPVVVFNGNEHILGLMVEEIIDVVEQDIEDNTTFEESDLSAIVLAGKTMDLVDINKIFEYVFLGSQVEVKNLPKGKKCKILMVDDSSFFRKLVAIKMGEKGFAVVTAKNVDEALNILKLEQIDIIITDINMPRLSGIEFAKIIKEDKNFRDIPIIALTSNLDSLSDQEKIREVGIRHVVSKTNQSELFPLVFSLINELG